MRSHPGTLSLRRLIRLYLTKAGFAVAEASTGPEALAALRRGNVDLAIVDVMLPEVDEFEVVRQARRNSSIPIILLTARGEEASRVAGLFVSNAIRYTPTGGRVQIQAHRNRSAAMIAVRDTGIGIAPEHLDRIFDRLYRAGEARDRATGGSGLGVAIARRAAQSLGARIEVDSTPGHGSEFRLLLPSVTAPTPAGAE